MQGLNTVREMDIYLIRFLEIQYLLSGYFPDVIEQNICLIIINVQRESSKFLDTLMQL